MWSCLTFTTCLFHALIKSPRTSLPGELRLAPHAPSPGWKAFLLLLLLFAVQVPWQGCKWGVAVACGSLQGSRADWLVEKCTELGACSLRPIVTERSPGIGKLLTIISQSSQLACHE